MHTKFIFVTGGVISGLGKGITCASIANLIQSKNLKVSVLKADMYLNLDAGTMNPLVHGEVFVTEKGLETDQDLGHYERFLNRDLNNDCYFTMGQVYFDVITKERSLGFEGNCVEGHIHVPENIIEKLMKAADQEKADVMFVEVGGTVGEYQNVMFYEAIRRFKQRFPENIYIVHLVYLMVPEFLGEMKSKPAQASIYELYKLGLQPNVVVCRGAHEIDDKRKKTLSFNTGIPEDHIFSAQDVDTIYRVPQVLKAQGVDKVIIKDLKLKVTKKAVYPQEEAWDKFVANLDSAKKSTKKVKIAIAGKYITSGKFMLEDSYVCVLEALKHAGWTNKYNVEIFWLDSEKAEQEDLKKVLAGVDGIIVPQGWGKRGVEGKLKVVKYARENKIPYLGLCFGMQMAVIEYSRNVLGYKDANSEEVNPKSEHPVIHIMEHQKKLIAEKKYGGTIRLGAYPCKLTKGTILAKAYASSGFDTSKDVMERHRHRYEFNNDYRAELEKAGLVVSGTSPDGLLVESVELSKKDHPFFVGTQFHPEYKSRPLALTQFLWLL